MGNRGSMNEEWHHTTVMAVRRGGVVAVGSDGQVTLGTTVLKQGAAKVRRLAGGKVLAGFAGSVADALALFTRFESKLEEFEQLAGFKIQSDLRGIDKDELPDCDNCGRLISERITDGGVALEDSRKICNICKKIYR